MSAPSPTPPSEVRSVTSRAVRRLGWLETVLALGAAVVVLLAGALTGGLLSDAVGWPFQRVWLISSVLYLVVPVVIVRMRDRRSAAAHRAARERERRDATSRDTQTETPNG